MNKQTTSFLNIIKRSYLEIIKWTCLQLGVSTWVASHWLHDRCKPKIGSDQISYTAAMFVSQGVSKLHLIHSSEFKAKILDYSSSVPSIWCPSGMPVPVPDMGQETHAVPELARAELTGKGLAEDAAAARVGPFWLPASHHQLQIIIIINLYQFSQIFVILRRNFRVIR